MKKQKRDIKIIIYIITILLVLLNIIIHFESLWVEDNVGTVSIDEVIFHLKMPLEGTSNDLIYSNIIHCIVPSFIIFSIFIFLLFYRYKKYSIINFKCKEKVHSIRFKKIAIYAILLLSIFLFVYQFVYLNSKFKIINYVKSQFQKSTFIEENYVDPRSVKITFPEQKRNLIYIYLESMESNFSKVKLDGIEDYNLIPELSSITNDSNDLYQVYGASWTSAGMVAQTAGLPLNLPMHSNYYVGYDEFLPNIQNLGDILKENGYNQVIVMGSDSNFSGKLTYYSTHGEYTIKDLYTARDEGIIPEDYSKFWGFEDSIMFEYAKKQLSELSSKEEPFNLTLLTENSHFPDGYQEEDCVKISDSNEYANSIRCSSAMIGEFLEWLKEQDFYDNTTIILAGDHLSMANNSILEVEERKIYVAVINGEHGEFNLENKKASSLDMFPTTLTSLGVEIEGNRLGLGTNLYSEEQTLIEKFGLDTVNSELSKKSDFYDSFIYKN